MAISSPEEEEEPLEEVAEGSRRKPLPSSALRDLLQPSPSRRSMSSRASTLTPTPRETVLRKGSQVGSRSTVLSRGNSTIAEENVSQARSGKVERRRSRSRASSITSVGEEGKTNGGKDLETNLDDEIVVIDDSTNATALSSKSTHRPPKPSKELIIIDSDSPSFSVISHTSPSTVTSLPRPLTRPRNIKSTKGTPYIDIKFLPINHLRNWKLPPGYRHPTALSRFEQTNLNQSPTKSEAGSSSTAGPSTRPKRSDRLPKWATQNSESSDDLGGYGTQEESDQDEDMPMSDDSDEIVIRRRTTRANGKGKGREERRRTTRAAAINHKPRRLPTRHDFGSSRSTSMMSETTRDTTPRPYHGSKSKGKGKAKAIIVSSDEDFEIGEEDEDELDNEDDSDFDIKPKIRGRGGKNGKQKVIDITDDVLYQHRSFCEKCGRGPADVMLDQAREKKSKSKGKKRKRDEDAMSDEEIAQGLEGWLTCKRCVVASHWGCLASNQKKDVLADLQAAEGPVEHGCRKIRGVGINEEASFTCSKCSTSLGCLVCHKDKIVDPPQAEAVPDGSAKENGGEGVAASQGSVPRPEKTNGAIDLTTDDEDEMDKVADEGMDVDAQIAEEDDHLRFRCYRCKQEAHYEHLPDPYVDEVELADIAAYYQRPTIKGRDSWQCHQCRDWIWSVDIIIAWRPLPAGAKEDLVAGEVVHFKDNLPREYLVKWTGRGFRHVTWVPHQWLLAAASQKLRNFLEKGPSLDLITDETLAARGDDMPDPTISNLMDEADKSSGGAQHLVHIGDKGKDAWIAAGPAPDVDGTSSIPIAWTTIDRILDVMLLPPVTRPKGKGRKAYTRDSSADLSIHGDATETMIDGIEPPPEHRVNIDQWEELAGNKLGEDDVDQVAKLVTWCYAKWDDLQYDQSTWDTPPCLDSDLYPPFKTALKRYLRDRLVVIPILSGKEREKRETKAARFTRPPTKQPECIVGGTLMPFQMNGFQWLLTKFFKRESCILADDMGLGKTIQIASLLGYLGSDTHKTYPFLVVVPNSTITNWVREFEKWVPHMRVVPYYGASTSRKVISKYELYRNGMQRQAEGLNAHVVLTTYDMITGPEFSVFGKIPRWEMLVVDEGQRLKSDTNSIFNRLKTLNTVHRILLTGTPLNNNLRELFNLLNFLDPINFQALGALEEKFSDLNENLLAELHTMIQPYILRRIKADVLRLPPKIEIIVPISLTPVQKKIYKGILERHADLIQAVMQQRKKKAPKPKPVIEGGGAIDLEPPPAVATNQEVPVPTEAAVAPMEAEEPASIETAVATEAMDVATIQAEKEDNQPGPEKAPVVEKKGGVDLDTAETVQAEPELSVKQKGGEVVREVVQDPLDDQDDCLMVEDTI